MASSRTYLLARVWEDYTDAIKLDKFGLVPDSVLGPQLDRVAAEWIRGNIGGTNQVRIGAWALQQPPPEPEFLGLLDAEERMNLGIRFILTDLNRGTTPRHPRWIPIHAESSMSRANDIATTLEQTMHLGVPFQIGLCERSTMPVPSALRIERELQEWEKRHPGWWDRSLPRVVIRNPHKQLRDEAMKLSPLLDDTREDDKTVVAPGDPENHSHQATLEGHPNSPVPLECAFVKGQGAWSIRFGEESSPVADQKGMTLIVRLLQSPLRSVHVWELETGQPLPDHLKRKADTMMDRKMVESLESEIAGLKDQAEELRSSGEIERAEELDEGIGRLLGHVQKSRARGGDSRSMSDELENCRSRVGKAITAAIASLKGQMPHLYRHLVDSIKKPGGFEPCYIPSIPVHWITA